MESSSNQNVEVIKKPRTNYSNTVLRRAVPNVNLQLRKESITMVKLKVLTTLKLPKEDQLARRVRTVDDIPKIISFVSHQKDSKDSHPNRNRLLDGVDSIREDVEEDSRKESRVEERLDSLKDANMESSDEGSSIDAGEDEEQIYQQIIAHQAQPKLKATVDDLVDKETIDVLKIIAQFKYPSLQELESKFVNFGPPTKNKVLVMDMDETLIHAKFLTNPNQEKNDDGDFMVQIASKNNVQDIMKVSVKMRPFLDSCLEHLARFYEIAVFTAGEQTYADAVLDYLDEGREIIKHRLYRQHCVNVAEGTYVKDLRIIQDRDLKDIILVDNSIVSFAFNLDNGVPISGFVRQKNDEEFLYLVTYLEEIYSYPDVREHIQKTFKLK